MCGASFCRIASAVVFMGLAATHAGADSTYDESLNGEISSNRLVPTVYALTPGINQIVGTFGPSGIPDVQDVDYLTVVVPAGHVLTNFKLVSASVGGGASFVGIQAGNQITVPLDAPSPAPLLGWTHFGSADQGRDLLPAIAVGSGAIGFIPPLPAGAYALWIMELDMGEVHRYWFELKVLPLASACPPDVNNSGDVSVQDIFDFLAAYFSGGSSGDFNSSGVVSVQDIFDFLAAYFVGCP